MQVIYKYRILIGIGIIIGHTFLISLALTARDRIRRSPKVHERVNAGIETDSSSIFRLSASDSIKQVNSGLYSEEKVTLENRLFSIDF